MLLLFLRHNSAGQIHEPHELPRELWQLREELTPVDLSGSARTHQLFDFGLQDLRSRHRRLVHVRLFDVGAEKPQWSANDNMAFLLVAENFKHYYNIP